MRICMIGTGYVGLVTGACLAEMGNNVRCVDVDEEKIARLNSGIVPIYEPGLEDIIKRNVVQGRLQFTTDTEEAVTNSLFIFIAVGTPPMDNGEADLRFVLDAAREIGQCLDSYKIIVTKSTVPVGTTEKVKGIITDELSRRQRNDLEFDVAFCPEFLKEGSAVEDFMRPDRIVIGTDKERTSEFLKELFSPFVQREPRIISMSIPSAEMTKYASNAMLATRISFMNELANFCESAGADIEEVRHGMGSDKRIGTAFLYPGVGYGGSCFPKDVKALIQSARERGHDLTILKAVEEVNKKQKQVFLEKINRHYDSDISGKRFAVWGLSFKPHTDDIREAPAIEIIRELVSRGATVKAFDPVAMGNARVIFEGNPGVTFSEDSYGTLSGADALVLVTEWPQFRKPDFDQIRILMKEPVIFDGRNQYNPELLRKHGFIYYGVGRN
ncbi:MAG: UDP-glucose 6-dehydrogenase TuaD [Synergistetes bacterium ADurb.Bin155]|nr:MAG: UDP-glucose 6-dehydrogenase TuaD [Synergistetes bacterium ADurb.Bin155]HOC81449.1 UDP-glucose/GDP-mannose dehydrogenase family protein [Synergistales bacterium]HQL03013.1 UDP-glucose/GDP-mannose dehydrogenase family protein [Synergistales bacterium]